MTFAVNFVGYLYIMDLINAREMELLKWEWLCILSNECIPTLLSTSVSLHRTCKISEFADRMRVK